MFDHATAQDITGRHITRTGSRTKLTLAEFFMASLKELLVMTSTANTRRKSLRETKLVLVVTLMSLICVTTALAASDSINPDTVSDQFKFYKTNANGKKSKVIYDHILVINCTTNDPSADTNLYLKPYEGGDEIKIVESELFRRERDVFTVKKFGIKTSGLYECRSTNKYDQTIKWNDPEKEVTPAEEHIPKAVISTKNKFLDVGDNFNLSCISNYHNTLNWFKVTNKSIYQTPRFKTTTTYKGEDKKITMFILNAQVGDSGYYVCESTYDDKNDTKRAHIIVLEPTKPQLANHSGAVVVRSPSPISIYCNFRGYPPPMVKWYYGTKEIKGCFKTTNQQCKNARVIMENRKDESGILRGNLTVLKTTYSDHGNYACEASNNEGDDGIAIPVSVETQARILVDPKDQSIITKLGKPINITCQSKGHPMPVVSWTKTDGVKVLKHGIGTAVLTIRAINMQDMGNYTCNATNFYSDLKVFTVKTVLKSTNPQPPRQQKARSKSDHVIAIAVCVSIIMLFFIAIAILLYRRQNMLSKKYNLGLEIADYQIDPDRSLLEQCKNLPYDLDWEFPEERLFLGETLGSGAFGQVLKAEAVGIQALCPRDKTPEAVQMRTRLRRTSKKTINETIKKGRCDSITFSKKTVAVKTLKGGASKADYTDLASELKILIHLGEHKNIVNILGACTRGRGLMVIIEFAPHGNMLTFLRERRDIYEPKWEKKFDNPGQELTLVDLVKMAYSISQGMEFLASKKCVHRDLAARNILVGQDYVIKISDFGLARDIYQEDLYVKTSRGLLPIKWMALESLFDRVYTHMSDVWSFGIVLWEIFTLGGTPYPTVPVEQLMEFLTQGQRMLQPNCCPTELYDLMKQCWDYCPPDRPTFVEISFRLEQIFQDNVSVDTLGYLLLSKDPNMESNMMASEAPTSPSIPCSEVSYIQSPLSTNNNQYNGTSKGKKLIEHKPLLNHESAV